MRKQFGGHVHDGCQKQEKKEREKLGFKCEFLMRSGYMDPQRRGGTRKSKNSKKKSEGSQYRMKRGSNREGEVQSSPQYK